MCENHTAGEEVVVEGSKRQLPPWMMHKVGASHMSKSDNGVETNGYREKRELAANAGNEVKKNAETDRKRETSKRKSNSHAKCEVKKRKHLSRQDGSRDNITLKEKRKNGSSRNGVQKSSVNKGKILEDSSHGSCDVYPVQTVSDIDVDLTVEDLITIAEEYVKNHEDKEQQEASGRQCEFTRQFPATSESGTTLDSPCENKRSSSSAREAVYNSTPTTTGEFIAPSTSQTGDPAQDMLELFLGPLLRKPLEKEEEKNKSIVECLEFTDEFTRKSQDELVGEEIVPLMKKRNTLKDKVAMFLG